MRYWLRRFIVGLLVMSRPVFLGGEAVASEAKVPSATLVPVQHQLAQPDERMPILNQLDFAVGRSFFRNPWVQAPASTDARDGLGPLFNSVTCLSCHVSSARGFAPQQDKPLRHQVVRLSVSGDALTRTAGVVPEPGYGVQLQSQSLPQLLPEGQPLIRYQPVTRQLRNGTTVVLRKPELRIEQLNYGALSNRVQTSIRLAPAMTGLGLLEAVPEKQLLAWADAVDANGDGISGRANRVWDIASQQFVMGRFGWKAEQPTILQQTAGALHADLGITSTLMPEQDCTPIQQVCQTVEHGGEPEISDHLLQRIAFYVSNLAVPAQRDVDSDTKNKGQALFFEAGCQQCHRPTLQTGVSEFEWLSNRKIYPYTDLLLHDMGEDLADNRPVFGASGREWRTPPLWGIGLAKSVSPETGFLHDGRARNVLEAILWHGGEALQSRIKVEQMSAAQRDDLVRFVESL